MVFFFGFREKNRRRIDFVGSIVGKDSTVGSILTRDFRLYDVSDFERFNFFLFDFFDEFRLELRLVMIAEVDIFDETF